MYTAKTRMASSWILLSFIFLSCKYVDLTVPMKVNQACHLRQSPCRCILPETVSCFRSFSHKHLQSHETRHEAKSKNRFIRLDQSSFKNLSRLRHLILHQNAIDDVDPRTFEDLRVLNKVDLSENRLTRLHPFTFGRQSQLMYLSLAKNRLERIDGIFSNLHLLRTLDVSANQISSLDDDVFQSNRNLTSLDLSFNKLRTINRNIFAPLALLRHLSLRRNPLGRVEFSFERSLHGPMQLLDLSECRLDRVPSGLPRLTDDLRLTRNRIRQINATDFNSTDGIGLLILSGNSLRFFDDAALAHLRFLHDLDLRKNQLQRIPEHLPSTLLRLYADHNRITRLTLPSLSHLQYLHLKGNRLTQITDRDLRGLSQLVSLDFSQNDIQQIRTGAFESTVRLQRLDLSQNPIRKMERRCLFGLHRLHILQMSSVDGRTAKVQFDSSIFTDTPNLLYLDLSSSPRLARDLVRRSLRTAFTFWTLKDLNLMDDNLSCLPLTFGVSFPNLRALKLTGNPWQCDRALWWLIKWLRKTEVDVFEIGNIRCHSPNSLTGRPIVELTETDLG